MRRTGKRPGPPSVRLVALLEGDLPDHRREPIGDGLARFTPDGSGPVIEVKSRIEKRFLGRTEVAVFETDLRVPLGEASVIAIEHTGGLRRTGIKAKLAEGSVGALPVVNALNQDPVLTQVLLPLDFTRFEIHGDPTGSKASVELMGASHVAIALPPIRSYVHLHSDQREAMLAGFEELRRILKAV